MYRVFFVSETLERIEQKGISDVRRVHECVQKEYVFNVNYYI